MGKLDKKNIEDILALTPMQEGMLYHYLKDPGSHYYSEQLSLDISGALDFKFFEQAWNSVVQNNQLLRTVFRWEKVENPVQIILKQHPLNVRYHDLPGEENEKKEKWIEKIKTNDRNETFDISDVPFRVTLCKINENKYKMIISNHHILYDGWSNGIILKEFFEAYETRFKSYQTKPPVKAKFKEFSKWIQTRDKEKQGKFWREYLKGFDTRTELSIKSQRAKEPVCVKCGGTYDIVFDHDSKDKLESFVKRCKITMTTLFYGAWGILLQKYNNCSDIVFGTTVSGRNAKIKGLENTVGLFINTIPLRVKEFPSDTALGLLARVNNAVKMREAHENTPLVEIKSYIDSDTESELVSKEEIFDSIVVIENYPLNRRLMVPKGELSLESYSIVEMTHYDLTVGITIFDTIKVNFNYNQAVLDRDPIVRMACHFKYIVQDMISHPGGKISDIEIITEEEKKIVLYEFNNNPGADYSKDATIHRLFEEQVEITPDYIALHGCMDAWGYEKAYITYRELNEKSDQLARILSEKGVQTDEIVGIMVKRSLEMIIGVLGILKAGGAYLPIDPDYPKERIDYMLADSGAKVLVTAGLFAEEGEKVGRWEGEEIFLEPDCCPGRGEVTSPVSRQDVLLTSSFAPTVSTLTSTSTCQVSSTNLAYIIYTSGSTGKPKGVVVTHKNVLVYLNAFESEFDLQADDVVIQQASFAFDAFVEELYPILLKGGKLVIPSKDEVRDIHCLSAVIVKLGVTLITVSPLLLNELNKIDGTHSVRIYISGADVLKKHYIDKLLKKGTVYNTYGPTEATVCATYYQCGKEVPFNVPIGKPIVSYRVYIVDKHTRLLPSGVPGELCVTGPGVSRGYLNNPELTCEKFVLAHSSWLIADRSAKQGDAPASSDSQKSPMSYQLPAMSYFYRTGDLGRWLADGNIEFLGRIDNQVKIRGFRIELGEIESQLLKFDDIKEVAVIDRIDTSGDKYLCAYFVSYLPVLLGLKEYLSRSLPAYMIPSYFVQLQKIPLTPSGKVDRKALLKQEIQLQNQYIAPQDEVEEKLAGIWTGVLETYAPIGIDDNFFDLGGHSLKAMILVSRIHKEFGVAIPLGEIFKTPTIRRLAGCIRGRERGIYVSIESVEEREYYPLSSAQKRLFFLDKFEDIGTAYNMSAVFRIEGKTDKVRFENTFNALIARHEPLRTSFHLIDDEAVQRVHDQVDFEIEYDLSLANCQGRGEVPSPNKIETIIQNFIRPFDLSRAPLLRVGMIEPQHTPAALHGHPSQEGKGHKYVLIVDMHHIISDGTSIEILFDDFIRLYEGENQTLQRIQYKDFAWWQNQLIEAGQIKEQENYWLGVYADSAEIPLLNLPTDFPRPPVFCFEGGCSEFKVESGTVFRVKDFSSSIGATLYMTLMAGLNILLHKYTGQEDMVVGSGIMGRRHGDLHHIMGMFVNSLALRNYPHNGKTCLEFLKEVKENSIQAFENQDVQFEYLVEQLNPPRDPSRNPIFDVLIVVQNFESSKREMKTLRYTPYPLENKTSKFDFTLFVNEIDNEIFFDIEYCTALFKEATIQRMAVHFLNVLRQMVNEPGIKIGEMEILTPKEKQQLLIDFNDTAADYPGDRTIHQLFEKQVRRRADNIAIVGPLQMEYRTYMTYMTYITYRELNRKSNQLAHLLKEKGIPPDTIVGIMMERCVEMIIGILGILKAGGAYLPIDPDYPKERIDYMLADSGAKVLVTAGLLAEEGEKVRRWEGEEILTSTSTCQVSPTNLAYIIYTSGTTGKPKGVIVEHGSLVNLCCWHNRYFNVMELDRTAQYASIGFDASVWEIFPYLVKGVPLHIISNRVKYDIKAINAYFERHHITIAFLPTPVCERFMEFVNRSLRLLLTGGDKLHTSKKRNYDLYNNYGPTENTVVTTSCPVEPYVDNIPIGKPIHNNQVYILNRDGLHLQPVGVLGELCIAGRSLARGYLNDPELTAEKFDHDLWDLQVPLTINNSQLTINNSSFPPIPPIPHFPIYRTGDLGRWLPDGNIEFLGRIDNQVKIRGFRVELGEIESQLLTFDGIKEAVALVREDKNGDKYLCAYIVAVLHEDRDPTHTISPVELRKYLSGKLPGYMIPVHFVRLEKMPLTPSGKIDRSALPGPEIKRGNEYAAPGDKIEKKLAEIWSEILNIDGVQTSIGIDDNFFQLGGHSLNAAILVSRIHKEFGVTISLGEIFKTPTIRALGSCIRGRERVSYASIEPAEEREYYPLSSAQKRLFFLDKFEDIGTTYNMSAVFRIEGKTDKMRFENTLNALIARHEPLRTSFHLLDDEAVQRVHDETVIGHWSLVIGEGDRREIDRIIKDFIKPFDLSQAPLMRAGLWKLAKQEHLFLFDIHHIISDGTSTGILVDDFIRWYDEEKIPPLKIQYKDFAWWQNQLIETGQIKEQENYWLEVYPDSAEIPLLNLPTDFPRPPIFCFEGDYYEFKVESGTVFRVKDFLSSIGATLYMTLMAGLNILLHKYTGQEDMVVGSGIMGRRHGDLHPIIGMFVNSLALRNYPHNGKTCLEFLKEVKESSIQAFENQDVQFE
ncbi:MAG: amino acid adenylation domain-containing protein, partial [Candidatus Aminicenantes bacterium]